MPHSCWLKNSANEMFVDERFMTPDQFPRFILRLNWLIEHPGQKFGDLIMLWRNSTEKVDEGEKKKHGKNKKPTPKFLPRIPLAIHIVRVLSDARTCIVFDKIRHKNFGISSSSLFHDGDPQNLASEALAEIKFVDKPLNSSSTI